MSVRAESVFSVETHTPTLIQLCMRSQTQYKKKKTQKQVRTPMRIIAASQIPFGLQSMPSQTPNHRRRHVPPRLRDPTVALTDRQRRNCNALVVCVRLMPPQKMLNAFTQPWTSTPNVHQNPQTPSRRLEHIAHILSANS